MGRRARATMATAAATLVVVGQGCADKRERPPAPEAMPARTRPARPATPPAPPATRPEDLAPMALHAAPAIDPNAVSAGPSGLPSDGDTTDTPDAADAGDATDAAADPCPAPANVVAIRATATTLVVALAADDDELPPRELTLDRRSGRILHDGPATVTVELPDTDFDNDSDSGRPVQDGLTVCPTDRPCVQLVPRHRRDDALARVRVRADGRVLGLAIDQGDRGARIELWDLVSNRRRGRLDLAALDPGSAARVDVAFAGDAVVALAIDGRGLARGLVTDVDGRQPRPLAGHAADLAPGGIVALGGGRLALARIGAEGAELITDPAAPGPTVLLPYFDATTALHAAGGGLVAYAVDVDDGPAIVVADPRHGTAGASRIQCR